MFVLGAGIGLIMQVLTIIVQNTADYRDLGTATSGVTFFRTLGSAFGAAVFGTIYANVLRDRLPAALAALARGGPRPRSARPRRCTRTRPRRSRRSSTRTPTRCTWCSCSPSRSPCWRSCSPCS